MGIADLALSEILVRIYTGYIFYEHQYSFVFSWLHLSVLFKVEHLKKSSYSVSEVPFLEL